MKTITKTITKKIIGLLALVFTMSYSINAQTPGNVCTYYVDFFEIEIPVLGLYDCNGVCVASPDLSSCTEIEDFTYTGSPQEWIVPCGVTQIQVDAWGASGTTFTDGSNGTLNYGGNGSVGQGGRVQANLSVSPGQVLYFYVGGSRHFTGYSFSGGGWNGGGDGPSTGCIGIGAPGGGATDIRLNGTALTDRILVAGGGGGQAAGGEDGGDGGGLVGQNGSGGTTNSYYGNLPIHGFGGSQSEGGSGGYMWYGDGTPTYTIASGSTGGLGSGGNGVDCMSGGGGGGYYGGGGGTDDGGGGGGSSYTNPDLASGVIHTQGGNLGHGSLSISYIIGDVGSCYVDECGVINGDNTTCMDECGVPNGDNSSCTDECGVINGDNTTCMDECGVPNGDNSSCADECGVPNGDNSSCTDECGVIWGDNTTCMDECGVPNGNGYYYFYADSDSDGLGEGDLITTCSDLSQQFCGTLSVSSGSYANEVSWNIQSSSGTEASGGAPYSSEFCLNQGDYTVNMYDSYGDGWNGSSLSFNGQSFSFSSGSSSSGSLSINSGNTESSYYVTNGDDLCPNDPENDPDGDGVCSIDEVYGCQDSGACNFNSLATESDESCEYTSCLDDCGVLNGDNSSCSDECGVPNGDNSSCTDECGVINGDNTTCMDECGVPNGDNSSCTDECGVINGDNSSCSDECGVPNGDNSSCTDECGVINGDNSSCSDQCGIPNGPGYYYAYIDTDGDGIGEGEAIESCNDLTASYCGSLSFNSGGWPEEVSWTITDNNSSEVASGNAGSNFELCLPTGVYTVNMYDSYGDGWNGNTLLYNGNSITLNSGSSGTSGLTVTNSDGNTNNYVLEGGDTEITGCTNSEADNYLSSANTDDGTCIVSGCMDSNFAEYNVNANLDDGSCSCPVSVELNVADASCDLTDGSANVTGLECNGMVTDSEHQYYIDECLNGNGYYCTQANNFSYQYMNPMMYDCFNYGDHYSCEQAAMMYPEEMANFLGTSYDSEHQYYIDECLNGNGYYCTQANNFSYQYMNPMMYDCFNYGDHYSCEQAAMMHPEEMASFLSGQSCYSWADSEGSLLSDQESVSNLSAGTYTFTYTNGECSYSESFEVGLSCSGCTDSSAFNYNENANVDDGSCIAVVIGCMDATAFNYNPEANTSDDSCIPVVLGCIDNAYMEYDEVANTDDGSCIVIKVFGCMDDTPNLMSNYNPDANVDDGSCISWEQMVLDLESQLNNIVVDDGIGQADIDAVQGELTLALETIESLNAQISNVDLALTSEDLTYLTEFINGLLTEISILLNSSELDLNTITALSETYLTPAIDYLTENDLVSDDQVAMLYEILLQVGVLLSNQEDGISLADVDAAYAAGAASVTPEDGIGQADVDAAYAAGAASVTPEDGIGQADLDAAYAAGAASVEIPLVELDTENIPLHLPQGWSMFGYTCIESVDVLGGFAPISEKIEIVKDEWGLAYLPAWGFSAFETLEFGEGYQIKMMEEVTDFQFCSTIIGYNNDNSIDSISNSVIGAWGMHSVYDLNQTTDEWESVDLEDIGADGATFIIDAENIYFTANYYVPYITNYTNNIQFNIDGEDVVWLYSFANEHPFTGEVGNYLLIEENYVYDDGTSDSRIVVGFQP